MLRESQLRRLARYCINGMFTAGLFFAVIYGAVEWLRLHVQMATLTAAAVALPVNFLLHKHWVFRHAERFRRPLLRYVCAINASFLANGIMIDLLRERLALHYLLAQLIATPILLLTNYVVLESWVFAARRLRTNPHGGTPDATGSRVIGRDS